MSDTRSISAAARDLALRAHGWQSYPPKGGVVPFAYHLGAVVGVLHRFGFDDAPVLVAAAWLHDVLEDTPLTALIIERELRAALYAPSEAIIRQVVDIVVSLTDEPGATREERKAKTYPKIVAAGGAAIAVKLADRIANVESSLLAFAGRDSPRFLRQYVKEHPGFAKALLQTGAADGPLGPMWEHLGRLVTQAREILRESKMLVDEGP